MPNQSPFFGLSAFLITPADAHGRVDAEMLARFVAVAEALLTPSYT